MDDIWKNFLTIVREESGSRVVDTWFKAISLYKWDVIERVAYLKAPNKFVREWLQNNYLTMIQTHLSRLLNVDSIKVEIVDGDMPVYMPARKSSEVVSATVVEGGGSSLVQHRRIPSRTYINSNYSFSDFVVGPSNSLAYAAAHAVTEKPGILYNPLFIYGGSGLGKTHLLHAIGNGIKELHNNAVILYQTTDRFVNEFISAIRFDKIHKFQEKYRSVDVLLIDDIQFISNKEQTQEAFFHIFNTLYESEKQIVFSSDTFPQAIKGIADRLQSRLASGLVTDILAPSLETKVAIIKKKAETHGVFLQDDIAHYIASRPVKSIRELEGSLVRVMAFSSLTKQSITYDLVEKVLSHVVESDSKAIGLSAVIKGVSKHYSYSIDDLKSQKRNKTLSLARHVTMFLMKRVTGKSLRDIGSFFGGRNHATIVHAIQRIEEKCKQDQEFHKLLDSIEREIIRG